MSRRRAFSLIELVAVIVVLAILAGVALPRVFNHGASARDSADAASIAGINTALNHAFLRRRSDGSTTGMITSVTQIAAQMETGALPAGITVSGSQLVDQRGNTYSLTAETATSAARVSQASGGSGSGGGSGGSGGGGSGGGWSWSWS